MSAGLLLLLLLLESSLEKTERDGEKGTDWSSWGKMLREPEFFIHQLIYGSKSAVEAVVSFRSRFWSFTPNLNIQAQAWRRRSTRATFTSALASDGHLVEQNFDLCRIWNSLQSLTCFFFFSFFFLLRLSLMRKWNEHFFFWNCEINISPDYLILKAGGVSCLYKQKSKQLYPDSFSLLLFPSARGK